MNKNIPNIISVSRIILCLSLFFLEPMSTTFLIVYAVTFLTDIVDGNLARMTGTTSDLGRRLDSIADVIFFLTFLLLVVPWVNPPLYFLVAAGAVAVVRMFPAILMGTVTGKYQTFHTVPAKLTAFLVFLTPYLYLVIGMPAMYILLFAFLLSSLYEYPMAHKFCKENCKY